MSTPVEYFKLHGKLEAIRAEHSVAILRAMTQAEEARDRQWRKRVNAMAARWERSAQSADSQQRANLCRAFARELRALGSPET